MDITTDGGAVHRSGFISLVGRPNAGKSTLLNAMLGTKLAIVADKPQTTRTMIQGVWTGPGAQLVFLDTPGIHEPKNLLHKRMMQHVRDALEGRNLIVFVADASRAFSAADLEALEWIKRVSTPAILVLNKIDLVRDKPSLLVLLETYRQHHDFAEYIPLSAQSGEGVEILRQAIVSRMPEGPRYFPEDYLTDQPERFLAAELVREKILLLTRQEVPHSTAVVVDKWDDANPALARILATIHVERPSHKAIVIGQKASMLKRIGTEARLEIEKLIGRKVYLELFVRVNENWRQKAQFVNELEPHGVQ